MLLARSPYAHSGRTSHSKTSAPNINQSDYDDDEKSTQGSDERNERETEDEAKSTQSAHDSADVFQELSQLNEEELVNSEEFARELQSAINHVQAIAKIDRQKMLSAAREHYRRDTGDDPTQQMMDDAMRTFVASESDIDIEIAADDANDQTRDSASDGDSDGDSEEQTETESGSEEQNGSEQSEGVDEQFVSDQLEMALGDIRQSASVHREEFVNKICDIYREAKGEEPSVMDLHRMVDQIKEQFADEAEDGVAESESETQSVTQSVSEDESTEESEAEEENEDELDDALDHVRELGTARQSEFVDTVCEIYEELCGEEPSTAELFELFGDIKERLAEEAADEAGEESEDEHSEDDDADYDPDNDTFRYSADEADDVEESDFEDDEENSEEEETEDGEFRREMDSALEHIRELGRAHQTQLVDSICDVYREANDEEPSSAELNAMCHVIKRQFSDEAADEEETEELQETDEEEISQTDEDDNYDPGNDAFDYTRDAQDRIDFGLFDTAEVSNPQSDIEQSDDVSEQLESEAETEPDTDSDELEDPFDEEMAIALEHVRDLGRLHQQSLVESACDLYARVNGGEPAADELRKIFAGIRNDFAAEAVEDDSESEDESVSESEGDEESQFHTDEEEEESRASTECTESELAVEEEGGFAGIMESALDHISKLGQLHQVHLANRICDIYAHENGEEITVGQLRQAVFDKLCVDNFELTENDESASEEEEEEESADSVSEEESEDTNEESEDEHSGDGDADYDPENDTFRYSADEADDVEELDSEDDESQEEDNDESDDDSDYDPQFDQFDYTRDAQDRIDLGLFPGDDDDDVLTSTDDSEYEVAREPVVLEVFTAEMQSALQHIRKLGKQHQKEFLGKVCDAFEYEDAMRTKKRDVGDEDALSMFANIANRKEFESALDSVRTLGGWHQESFVNRICDDFVDLNGAEPTISELHGLIGGIKQGFAEEANEVENAFENTETTEQTELAEVNSAHFATELESAIENASMMGQIDGRKMLQKVRAQFEDEFGEIAVDQMLIDAMRPFGIDAEEGETAEGETEDESDEEAVTDLNAQMENALEHTRELGRLHQRELVDSICGIYADLNGEQPTLQNLQQIFVRVKESFADETKRDFLNEDVNDIDDCSDDSDYDANGDDFDYREDLWDDVLYNDDVHDGGDEDYAVESDEDEADYARDALDEQTEGSEAAESGDGDGDDLGSEASYDPELDAFDYCDDIEDDFEEDEQEQSEEEDADYNPKYDTFHYSADEAEDVEAAGEENEDEHSGDGDADYDPENDTFRYSADEADDVEQSDSEDDESQESNSSTDENSDSSGTTNAEI